MSNTATLEDIRQRVLNRNRTLSDEVVSVKSLMMDPQHPGRMIVRPGEHAQAKDYAFDDRIYGQAAGVAYGLPGAYIKKLVEGDNADPGLAALNFNFWVDASKDKEILLRFETRGEEKVLRAMKPASWNPIPYEASIETLITKFGPDHEAIVEQFDDERLVLNFVTRKLDYKTNPAIHDIGQGRDDPFEWGIRFQDSDVGKGDLQIMPYSRRLICLNGATAMSKGVIMHISHSGKDSRVIEEVQATVRQGIEMVDGYSQRVSEQITASQGIELECNDEGVPAAAMGRLERDLGVTRLMQKYVYDGWETEVEHIPERTLYRLTNAVTRAGTHAEELSPDAKLHLQGVGGRMLEMATTNYIWNNN